MPYAFSLRYERRRLHRHFQLSDPPEKPWASRSEVFLSGSLVATIVWSAFGKPHLQFARFGFKMREHVIPMTNYRLETIQKAPTRAFLEGRCIVPVDLFHEQVIDQTGALRVAMYGRADDGLLGLAAMLRPEASGLAVAILTTPAAGAVKSASSRMPAVVSEDDYDSWLDDTTPVDAAATLISGEHGGLIERAF